MLIFDTFVKKMIELSHFHGALYITTDAQSRWIFLETGKTTRATKRAQDVTVSSATEVIENYQPSPMKRCPRKSFQAPVRPAVATRNVKIEPRSPEARWAQALAAPAHPR